MLLPHDHGWIVDQNMKEVLKLEDFQIAADIFKKLDDASRLRIFWLLCHCEECVTNISTLVDMTSPAVSHHLRQLKTSGLVITRREGKEVYYTAANTQQAQFLHHTIEKLLEIACPGSNIWETAP